MMETHVPSGRGPAIGASAISGVVIEAAFFSCALFLYFEVSNLVDDNG